MGPAASAWWRWTEGRRSRVVISCMYPIREGIKVQTDSPRVANVRRWIVQLLLDESPGAPKSRSWPRPLG